MTSAPTKWAAVRAGTDDFADGDCWYFNARAAAEQHAAVRAAAGVPCDIRPVPAEAARARLLLALRGRQP